METIKIIATASRVSEKAFECIRWAIDRLSKIYHVKICEPGSSHGHYAATAQERAAQVMKAFEDKQTVALVEAQGGLGSLQLLEYLDFAIIRQNPKLVFGFSDTTALQNGLLAKVKNIICPTGFVFKYDYSRYREIAPIVMSSLCSCLANRRQSCKGGESLVSGKTEGRLLGGNLTSFCSLTGTPYMPELKNSVLLLEDVGESPARIDRMLTQLSLQKGFSQVKGIVFGAFTQTNSKEDINFYLDEFAHRYPDKVIVKNFPYGHIAQRYVLPLGKKVQLTAAADGCRLEL